jgi:molybdopterin molybdotransferase
MRPGAPLAFTCVGEKPVFGLPGNPVSTLVTFELFVRPALLSMMGHTRVYRAVDPAVLAGDFAKAAGRAHFVRVELERREGALHARPTGDQSSGILLSMVRASGLACFAEDATRVPAGTLVPVLRLDSDDLRAEPGI